MQFSITIENFQVTRLPVGHAHDRLWVGFVVTGTGLDEGWALSQHIHINVDGKPASSAGGGGGGTGDEWFEYVTIEYGGGELQVEYLLQGRTLHAEHNVSIPPQL